MIFGRTTEAVHIYIFEWVLAEEKEILRGKFLTNALPEKGDFVKTDKGKCQVIEEGICTMDGGSKFYPYVLVQMRNPEY